MEGITNWYNGWSAQQRSIVPTCNVIVRTDGGHAMFCPQIGRHQRSLLLLTRMFQAVSQYRRLNQNWVRKEVNNRLLRRVW
jgi:hypothetical protein